MEHAFGALAVAAIGGITFIAYRHPNAYRIIFIVLIVCYIAATVAMTAWNEGSYHTYRALLDYIEGDNIAKAKAVRENYQIPNWIILSSIGVYAYLCFLYFLPNILDADKPS
jgi:hypothetical protein